MKLSDTTKQKFDYILGHGGADEIIALAGTALSSESPTLVGTPLAPTAPVGTNTTQIATCEFVLANQGAAPAAAVSSVFGRSGAVTALGGDYMVTEVLGAAPEESPSFTGTIVMGGAADSVGFFGSLPIGQPAGADQAAAPPPTATVLTYVGTADTDLGDSGNEADNNRLASVAAQVNNTINDMALVRELVNRLRDDLTNLGLIRGSAAAREIERRGAGRRLNE